MDATLTAALEKLELDAELLGVVEKVFNSCQSAISDSCSGGQSAEVAQLTDLLLKSSRQSLDIHRM